MTDKELPKESGKRVNSPHSSPSPFFKETAPSDMSPPKNLILDRLTPAERLVAVHLARGLSNKEMAMVLGKAEPTVKHQISAILRATGATGRCHFVALYYQQFLCLLPTERFPEERAVFFASASGAANRS